jgi:hypothetical protein
LPAEVEEFPKVATATSDPRPYGANRNSECSRDLLIGEARTGSEHENFLLALVEASESTSDPVVLGGLIDGHRNGIREVRLWFAHPRGGPQTSEASALRTAVLTKDVGSNAQQPRTGIVEGLVISGPGAEGGDERLGHHIVDITRPGPVRHIPMDCRGVPIEENPEAFWAPQRRDDKVGVSRLRPVSHQVLLSAVQTAVPILSGVG